MLHFVRWLRYRLARRQAAAIMRQAAQRYAFAAGARAEAVPVVDYLADLTPEQKAQAEAITKAVMGQVRETLDKQTDPATRPGFNAPTSDQAVVDHPVLKKGYLPPTSLSGEDRESALKGFNVLDFPRGDIDNFSVTRWAAAMERSQNTTEGTAAFKRWAPWESAWYAAIEKAQGDMATGTDGGFLAPETWSTNFIDQLYPAMALSSLPVTRIPMGTRVVHLPRLSSAISISYTGENAALTASQAQFQQVS